MIPTKDQPGPFDAFERAQPGEPVFPLLGRDAAAPGAITEWCRLRRMQAIRKFAPGSEELTEELRQCADAEVIAMAMSDYRLGREADPPAAERIAHSGLMGETADQRERNRQIAETVEHLRNAECHMAEADALLGKLFSPEAFDVFGLAFCIMTVKKIDEQVAPKRREAEKQEALPEPIAPSFAGENQ